MASHLFLEFFGNAKTPMRCTVKSPISISATAPSSNPTINDRDAWLQTYGHCFCCFGGKGRGGSGAGAGRRGSGCIGGGGDESPVSRLGRSSHLGHGTTVLDDIGGPTPRTSVR